MDVTTVIVTLAAVAVVVAALRAAQALVMPIVFTLFLASALNPWVRRMERLGLRRAVASALVLGMLFGGAAVAVYTLSDGVLDVVNRFPIATDKIRRSIREWRRAPGGSINQLSEAASDLEAAAKDLAGSRPGTAGVARVEVVEPPLRIRELVLGGSKSLVDFSGELVTLAFFLYFVLASGSLLKKKAFALAEPSLQARRRVLRTIADANKQIEEFLGWLVAASALLAVLVSIVFWRLGLEHPVLWGLAAGVLEIVPYVGATVFVASSFAVALLQFGTIQQAAIVLVAGLVLTGFVGQWLKPWLMSRRARLNTPSVLLALLLFGWMWGAIGMLLSFPILVVVKTVADRFERFRPVAILLGQ